VRVLKFSAVDFDHRARIAKKDFGCSFDHTRLTGARGAKEKQAAYGAAM
jgi:hypothetical protein